MKKILISDKVHPILSETLISRGFQVDYLTSITWDEFKKVVDQYYGVIINSKIKMPKEVIDLAPQLRFIARLGSGMEIIDAEYARSKGIVVVNTPEGNCNAVGEHALSMLLSLFNHIVRADDEVRKQVWNREANRGRELDGNVVGIVGFGHTGKAFARKLRGFDVEVIAYDKYAPDFGVEYDWVRSVRSQDIQQDADIISFHLPLTPETKHVCNDKYLKDCKDGVVIINTSRGNVVDTKDLVSGLESGKVGGACLDVFENEKPPTYTQEEKEVFETLFDFKNVVLTPHVAGWTTESLKKIALNVLKKVENLI